MGPLKYQGLHSAEYYITDKCYSNDWNIQPKDGSLLSWKSVRLKNKDETFNEEFLFWIYCIALINTSYS